MVRASRFTSRVLLAALALVWLAISMGPFLFMLSTSFKDQLQFFTSSLWALPTDPSFDNFLTVIENDLFIFFRNSIVVVSISVVMLLIVGSMAAYAFARFNFPLRSPLYALIVAGLIVPIHVTLVPIFILTRQMGLFNTIWALIGPYVAFSTPVTVFILTGFMQSIPREIEDAARMDGAGPFRRYLWVVLPLSRPGLITVGIFNAVLLWNEFVYAFVLTSSRESRTLPLAIWDFTGEFGRDVSVIMALLVLTALPLVVAFILAQEQMIKGLMAGAVEG